MAELNDGFQLKIGIKCVNAFPVVELSGECDAFTAPFTHGAVGALIDAGYKGIVIDISNLEFLDVAGFHALDDCCRRIAAVDGKLFLINPKKLVQQIYDILQEEGGCEIVKSIDEAMAKLTTPST